MDLNLLKSFNKVAEMGSFTKAAKHLDAPKSKISRAVSKLEDELEIQLLKRSTRSISLTEAGQKLYNNTNGVLAVLEDQMDTFKVSSEHATGTLNLSTPVDLSISLLPDLLTRFSENYPKIKFNLQITDQYIDLNAFDIDVAIRVGNLKDSNLIHKKLGATEMILIASRNYLTLKNAPVKTEDLTDHSLITFYNDNQQNPLGNLAKKHKLNPEYKVTSFPIIKELLLKNKGIGVIPDLLVREELKSGLLIRVLPNWSGPKTNIQAVYQSKKNLPEKSKLFLDFLQENKKDFF